jgi:hypothetical protein
MGSYRLLFRAKAGKAVYIGWIKKLVKISTAINLRKYALLLAEISDSI